MVGFLLIDKPTGCTSHDVIARLRRMARTRIGHAGTLDPLASGLLVCGVGQATRLLGRLQLDRKTYEGTMRLGLVTATQDVTGAVLDKIDGVRIGRRVIELAAEGFRGTIAQVPPLYSAVKLGGVPMHRRLRRGMAYEPPSARRVEIYGLEVLDVSGADVHFRVECSSGTYVRTLCHDWGAKLEVGGCLAALRRTRSGHFSLDEAVPLDGLASVGDVAVALHPVEAAFPDLPEHRCTAEQALAVARGQKLSVEGCEPGTVVSLRLPSGRMFALARVIDHNEGLALKAAPVLTELLTDTCLHPDAE